MEPFDPLTEFALQSGASLSEAESVDLTIIEPGSKEAREALNGLVDAARAGSLLAMCKCAACYRTGWGTPVEPETAFALAQQAASADYPPGLLELGFCYEGGVGIKRNPALAAKCMLRAADGGYSMAALHVALLYFSGEPVLPFQPDLAIEYAIRSFEKGFSFAGHLLGTWYEEGKKMPRSNATAMRWYLAAADKGSLLAANRLALAYSYGQLGIAPDPELAHWYAELGQRGSAP